MVFRILHGASSRGGSPARAGGRRQAAVVAVLGLSLCAAEARGQTPPSSGGAAASDSRASGPREQTAAARAQALFAEGYALLRAKSYGPACVRFEESQRLDPSPGTLYNLAVCAHRQGHFATAWRRWREFLAQPGTRPRERSVAEAAALEAEKSAGRLVLRAGPDMPGGMVVSLDGRTLGAGELGAAVLVDPGAHRVVVTAPGREAREVTVAAGSGKTSEAVLAPGPALPPPPVPPRSAAGTATVPGAGPKKIMPAAADSRSAAVSPAAVKPVSVPVFLSQHGASLGVFGAGVAAAAVGAGLALDIVGGRYEAFVRACGSPAGCSQADRDEMRARAAAVNVLFGVAGAAGLAAGGLFFLAERAPSRQPSAKVGVAVGPAGVGVRVSW